MSHAVIRINEQDRQRFDAIGVAVIYTKFSDILRKLSPGRVLIYQSVRHAKQSKLNVGYFAEASVESILPMPERGKAAVFLSKVAPVHFGFAEDVSLAIGIEKGGRHAAADVREISDDMFLKIAQRTSSAAFEPSVPSISEVEAQSESHSNLEVIYRWSARPVRNPAFHKRVYMAYRGRCAISKVSFVSPQGVSGLDAAHIVPWGMSPHERASAGILLAPSWHRRFDLGMIIINDDFTWSAIIEDEETLAITDRRLKLPESNRDWPELSLLRKKRELFGR